LSRGNHLKQLCITNEFINRLIKDIADTKKEEDKMANAGGDPNNWLYG
jgi:hypothetical protein